MEESALEIEVTDEVVVFEGTAPGAVDHPVPSPYFQPEFTFADREADWVGGMPRGPTVEIDFDSLGAAFE